jgi:biotin transporter BioY
MMRATAADFDTTSYKTAVFSLAGILLLITSAKLSILVPGSSVALTWHVGALTLLCLLFPFKAARNAVSSYLLCYLSGLPVASAPVSLSIFSPIVGYLFGFCLFVECYGLLMQRFKKCLQMQLAALFMSLLVLHVAGCLWLSLSFSPLQAIWQGSFVFILLDSAKIFFICTLYKGTMAWIVKKRK